MRYGPDDKMWVVTDPSPESELADILFAASLRDISLQLKGGLSMDQNPTLFTDKEEAENEARQRLNGTDPSEPDTSEADDDEDWEERDFLLLPDLSEIPGMPETKETADLLERYGVEHNRWYSRNEFVDLLRRHKGNPDVIQFLADMLEE